MKLRYLFASALLAVLPVTAAHAVSVSISIAPPELLAYDQPVCPTEGYLWTPGYWAYDYDAGQYYWVAGVWVAPPRVGYLWTPGYWGYNNGIYAFNNGYWAPTVGFYGGINYGYGYGGYGYYGGRWDGRVFRYNTAITHVNANVVHNTYVDRSVVHNTTQSRAAFNGRGGIQARPDAKQLAASKGAHVGPTSGQTRAISQAKTQHRYAPGGARTDSRTRTANVTPNGRTHNVQRTPQVTRNNPALTNHGRTGPTTQRSVTPTHSGRNRTAVTRGSSRGPRGPQVARQTKGRAPQPHGAVKAPPKKH